MIQCVGSRDEKHPSCSRTCCAMAIKNALRLKKLNPDDIRIILYRDIRTYGFLETYYAQARREGDHLRPVRYRKPARGHEDGETLFVSFEDRY